MGASFRKLVTLAFSRLTTRQRQKLYLHSVVLARSLRSKHFREQRRNLAKFFPDVHFSPHLVYVRNWGEGASFALTRKFLVSVDSVNTGPHPEIEAVKAGQATADEYYLGLVEGAGWSKEAAEDRRRKTALLLEQDPADLFCEVTIHPTGALLIHDGFHRAAIMASSALGGVYVKVTINLFLT